jgi:WD40 repeat protein
VVAELASGQLHTLETEAMFGARVEFSPDGRLVAVADGNDLVLWDWVSGDARRLKGHATVVRRAFFSPDGSLVATTSEDNTVGLWKVADGSHRVLRGHTNVVGFASFSLDGQAVSELRGGRSAQRRVKFSPDGKLLAAADDANVVRLWNAATGDGYVVRGHERPVRDLDWAPDGRRLVSVGMDGRVQMVMIDELPDFGGHDARSLNKLLEAATTAMIGPDDRPVGP